MLSPFIASATPSLLPLLPILHGIPPNILPRLLLERAKIVPILIRNPSLDRIIRHGFLEQLSCELEHGADAAAGFPLVGFQHAEAHAAFVIVGDVWVVDLRAEGEGGWFERVGGWEGEIDCEDAGLRRGLEVLA